MENALNIAIIGGGLMGLSTADSLIHRGARVTVFEKDSHMGHGAGRYNSGMIHPSQARPWLTDDMGLEAVRNLVGWAEDSRDLLMKRRQMLNCEDVARAPGTLQLCATQLQRETARDFYNDIDVACRDYNGPWTFDHFALEFPEDFSGSAYHYCQKLIEDLRLRGCVFRTDTKAEPIYKDQGAYIRTENGLQPFDRIIVAAGAASSDILKPLGFDLPVSPLRGHALVFERPNCALPEMPIMHAASCSALTVFEDHVRLSGTVHEDEAEALLDIWQNVAPDIVKALGAPRV